MDVGSAQHIVATLADWSDLAGIVGALVASVGLVVIVLQLRRAAALSRAQATIQFQQAFRMSRDARERFLETFPIYEDVLQALATPEVARDFRTWKNREELTKQEKDDAQAVINALNDVAQYVVDGLSLRSALQQYHTIFVRAGALLSPYLDQLNAPRDGHPQARNGRRVVDLYNAGLIYHRCHPKHRGREIALVRRALQRSGSARLILLDVNGHGLREHPGFADEHRSKAVAHPRTLRGAVRAAERYLRR
jgi:hypothetical protein